MVLSDKRKAFVRQNGQIIHLCSPTNVASLCDLSAYLLFVPYSHQRQTITTRRLGGTLACFFVALYLLLNGWYLCVGKLGKNGFVRSDDYNPCKGGRGFATSYGKKIGLKVLLYTA